MRYVLLLVKIQGVPAITGRLAALGVGQVLGVPTGQRVIAVLGHIEL